jgi:hypothetical protein
VNEKFTEVEKMKQEIQTMAEQINAKELKFAKFILLANEDKNEITIKKGNKFLRIRYNKGSDLYDIQKGKIKNWDIIEGEVESGYFYDALKSVISDYFKFEYVMHMFERC